MSAALASPSADPARLPSAVLAVAVHLLLVVVLFFGVRWSSNVPEAVVVELWQPQPEPVLEKPEPPKPEPPKPEPKPEPVAKPLPKVEAKPPPAIKKPDIVVEKEKPPPKPKPVPKPEPKIDLDFRKQMQEQLQREAQALAQERARREPVKPATPPPTAAAAIDAAYANRIRAKIRGNLILPSNVPDQAEAIFDVIQLPTGEVLEVRLRKSSGHRQYDEAIARAIEKSTPLPRPDRSEQFQRQLELKFRPKDPV